MNRLVWKLLRRHLNFWQVGGFFLANLLGMCIVLLSLQFYNDVLPVFTQGDSFMKKAYIVVAKKVNAIQTMKGKAPSFTATEIEDIENQSFVKSVGKFTPAQFNVFAAVGSEQMGVGLSTEMFFEAIPDEYVDADLTHWKYTPKSDSLPVILPRNYLNLYNFGFATSRGLPALSEGLAGMVKLRFRLRGTLGECDMNGRVVAFSNRLNTILVPQSFMDEMNAMLSPDKTPVYSRLILDVDNPANEAIASYLYGNNYEAESGGGDAGRMAYFLRIIIGIVLSVGLIICALSFYVLLLSIFLLLQKHTEKIDNLLLIGYRPRQVALPFHFLSWGLNGLVLLVSIGVVVVLRGYYLPKIAEVYPQLSGASLLPSILLGFLLYLFISLLDYCAVHRKIMKIWYIHRK